MKVKVLVLLAVCTLIISCCTMANDIHSTVDDKNSFAEHPDVGFIVDKTYIEGLDSDTSSVYMDVPDFTVIESDEVVIEEIPETVPIRETEAVEETIYAEEIITPVYDYAEWELDLLARLIFAEGGTESYDTQLKIGSVVMNRVDSDLFPNTIQEVIYQENQFSVTFIEIDGITMIDRPADEEAKKAAYEILTYGSILPHEVQVFYLSSIEYCWVNTREIYSVSDNTIFAYIYERGAKE